MLKKTLNILQPKIDDPGYVNSYAGTLEQLGLAYVEIGSIDDALEVENQLRSLGMEDKADYLRIRIAGAGSDHEILQK